MAVFTCPTCQKDFSVARLEQAPDRPFCSYRCRMIDLAKWFNEEYRVEALPSPDPPQAPADKD